MTIFSASKKLALDLGQVDPIELALTGHLGQGSIAPFVLTVNSSHSPYFDSSQHQEQLSLSPVYCDELNKQGLDAA